MPDSSAGRGAVAASAYWAELVEPQPTKHEGFWRVILNVWGVFEALWPMERDPRYWILVGTHGSEDCVGVRTAKNRTAAARALAEVEHALTTMSPDEFRERLIEP